MDCTGQNDYQGPVNYHLFGIICSGHHYRQPKIHPRSGTSHRRQYCNETVLSLLAFKTIVVTSTFFPVACFMAVLMVFGRMYREQEMSAIASAGGGMLTLYRAVFWLLIPLSLCAAGLSLYASPWAEAKSQQMMHDDAETADTGVLPLGVLVNTVAGN